MKLYRIFIVHLNSICLVFYNIMLSNKISSSPSNHEIQNKIQKISNEIQNEIQNETQTKIQKAELYFGNSKSFGTPLEHY